MLGARTDADLERAEAAHEMGSPSITELLSAWREGDQEALERLLPQVYELMRNIAVRLLRNERPDHTLQPTALVHEAYLKLSEQTRLQWRDRTHFFAMSARIMRRLLVDHAREKGAAKRGGEWQRVSFDIDLGAEGHDLNVLDLDRALAELEQLDERQAKVVEARYFAGLSIEETAEALELSKATVKREWATARLWLYVRLTEAVATSSAG